MVDKVFGIIALAFMITALAITVSKRAQTSKVLTAFFGGIMGLQKAASSPLK